MASEVPPIEPQSAWLFTVWNSAMPVEGEASIAMSGVTRIGWLRCAPFGAVCDIDVGTTPAW